MTDLLFRFAAIGLAHSSFRRPEDIPRERNTDPRGFEDVEGEIEIFADYEPGLKDIDGFSHLIVIFAFHRAGAAKLLATPPGETEPRGVFATRSPHRPNPVGMTVVRLLGRKGRTLRVAGLDMVEGTPILDIKPYTAKDQKIETAFGWIQRARPWTNSSARKS